MREIKLKAVSDRMGIVPLEAVTIRFIDGVIKAFEYADNGQECELPIIQYIGLRDVDGVEIYEGDVLPSLTEFPYVVVWHQSEHGSGWKKKRRDVLTDLGSETELMQVIGNIHQNPELMK